MQRAKAFFFVCAGIFLLALAYHLGATNATAQAPSDPIVAADFYTVYTANGEAYVNRTSGLTTSGPWVHVGNVFTGGGPVSSQPQTLGQVKVKYR
jgi:hypothetical protein